MLTEPGGGAGTNPAVSTTSGRAATEAPRSGGGAVDAQEGEGGDYFAPGVIHVTPQDKEAIERVIYFLLRNNDAVFKFPFLNAYL